MPSLKNVQSKTATTILYLKCESMERISGFLSYRKNQTRVALNKVFIMLMNYAQNLCLFMTEYSMTK